MSPLELQRTLSKSNLNLFYATTVSNPFTMIKIYGNPGPWQKYDPRQDSQVGAVFQYYRLTLDSPSPGTPGEGRG